MRSPAAAIVALLIAASPAWGLEPQQIVLVANSNVPESLALAQFYAEQRHIPPGHVAVLKLPVTEEMPFEFYEQYVVPPLREFLTTNHLERSTTCLVTFRGIPLRVAARVNSPKDRQELTQLQGDEKAATAQAEAAVGQLESAVVATDPTFIAGGGKDIDALNQRADAALRRLSPAAVAANIAPIQTLGGAAAALRAGRLSPSSTTASADDAGAARRIAEANQELPGLQNRRYDPDARQRMRTIVKEEFGLIAYVRLVRAQIGYFATEATSAAVDSELALLWWPSYPRSQWQVNPMFYKVPAEVRAKVPPTLMVMRLDAPREEEVRRIITDSIAVEAKGLHGRVVLDSRGIRPGTPGANAGYAVYDQSIRNLGDLLATKTQLAITHDDTPTVLAAGSAKDVAIYCGWYSLNNYIPCCKFVQGAVGFHIASFELTSLKDVITNSEWVRGLINDGVDATLGPVAEPYLHAFPAADDFFPLLLTGKLSLAEVYWRTEPLTSWMITMIGDPLYVPYKVNPALRVEDLPERLQGAVAVPGTGPRG